MKPTPLYVLRCVAALPFWWLALVLALPMLAAMRVAGWINGSHVRVRAYTD